MSTIPTSSTPLFNVGGLASGLDTNTMISQLMAIERNPQVRMLQRQRVEEARQGALRDVNTRLLNLQSAIAGLRDVGTWGDVQTVDSSDPTRVAATRIGGAAAGGYQLEVTRLARAAQSTQGTATTAASADGTLTIQVGTGTAVDVSVTSGDSLQGVADRINGSSGMQVYASVINSKLVLSSKVTGSANAISVTGTSASDFGFAQSQAPLDAEFTVDGNPYTRGSNTVTDAIAGISLSLKATTSAPVSISIGAPGPDTSAVQTKVQTFIDQYNSTIGFIRSKLNEAKVPNPRTDDDRAKGVLNGDAGLTELLSKLRQAVSDPVGGRPSVTSMLSQVGVSTGSAVGAATLNQDAIAGKLTLDSTALSDQLNNHFSDVKALFTNVTGSYTSEGVAQRLDDLVGSMVKSGGILAGRIDGEQSTIDLLKQQQADMDVRLAAKEQALRQQFTAMEVALQQAQAQGQYLSGQIASLGTSG